MEFIVVRNPASTYPFHIKLVVDNLFVGTVAVGRAHYPDIDLNLAYVYDIEVTPSFRRRGYGKALIQKLKDILKPDGFTTLILCCIVPTSVPFYLKAGFERFEHKAFDSRNIMMRSSI